MFRQIQKTLLEHASREGVLQPQINEELSEVPESCEEAMAYQREGKRLYLEGRLDEAMQCCQRALSIDPDYGEALNNLGMVLFAQGEIEQALIYFRRAIDLKGLPKAHWNAALCHLLKGDFHLGWKKYEWRWKTTLEGMQFHFSVPQWTGQESLRGKTIFFHAEQGLGDTIQFCRYAQVLTAQGATVLLGVQGWLKPLLARLDDVHQIFEYGEPLPSFDYHISLLSIPLALGTLLHTIPANVPYIFAERERVNIWRKKLDSSKRWHVGLVWSGRSDYQNDDKRSIPSEQLTRLMDRVVGSVQFVSVQKEIRELDKQFVRHSDRLVYFGNALIDFRDTAALIATLDWVITVDTSVAHLAGAMGKPVWILLPFVPDWRWLLHREDSPWYPSARLFRQPKLGDWDSVIARVQNEISQIIQEDSPKAVNNSA